MKRTSPTYITVKTLHTMNKEKYVTYKGKAVRITGFLNRN
jgi:hypothetical protein